MNNKLTPLEALEKLKNNDFPVMITTLPPIPATWEGYTKKELFDIVEKALKEHELMKQAKIIVADKDISDEDFEKLKNQRMFVSNLEQCEIKPLFDEETQKKLKALEIIKENLVVFYDKSNEDKPCLILGVKVDKEKLVVIYETFDKDKIALLKEVLL